MSASGSLNINDLTLVNPSAGPFVNGGLGVSTATFLMGTNGLSGAQYSGFTTTPANFGTGGGGPQAFASGDIFGVILPGGPPYSLIVPVGYTTGTAISSSQTFTGTTFSGLGLTQGTYTYTWGSGANADSINVVIGGEGVTPTPTPTSGASGNFNVSVSQVGPNVVWSGSGSFNLTSLTLNQNIPGVTGGFNQPFAQFIVGPTSPSSATTYSGSSFTTFPTSFGSGGGLAPSSSSGSLFGVVQTSGPSGPREVVVPSGYVSGTVISGSMTYDTQTIAGMGLSGGTYTWSWGTGGNTSTLVMTINS
jgi:hypothetical protein